MLMTFVLDFYLQISVLSVFETHPVNPAQPFVWVFAIDHDSGENGRLSYSIQSSGMVPFTISETTGYVYLTSALNRSVSSHTVTVVARDHGTPALDGMTTLTVSVISPAPVGAPVPIFSPTGQQVISEGTVPGTSLITHTPQNPSNTLLYQFVENTDQFAISPNSGEVFLTRSLDHEAQSSAIYTIIVTDGPNTVTLVLPIVVSEVNEHRPQFTQEEFQITVMENFPNNQTFGSITATDPEGVIVYSLVDSQDPRSLSLFDVSSDGSVHTLFSEIDRKEIPVHVLTVAVRDFGDAPLLNYARLIIVISASNPDGSLTSQFNVIVNVIDVLDSTPVLLNPGTVTVQENLPVYTFVTSLADTSNISRPVFYSIVDGNHVTGEFTVTNNYQLQPQYLFTVSAIDGGGQRSSVQVTIFVKACEFQNLLFLPASFAVEINEKCCYGYSCHNA